MLTRVDFRLQTHQDFAQITEDLMMHQNVRATTDDILVHHVRRRNWMEAQERYHQSEVDHASDMLGRLILLGILLTGILLMVWV